MMKVNCLIYGEPLKLRLSYSKESAIDYHFDDFMDACLLIDITNAAVIEQSAEFFTVEYLYTDITCHKWFETLFERTKPKKGMR